MRLYIHNESLGGRLRDRLSAGCERVHVEDVCGVRDYRITVNSDEAGSRRDVGRSLELMTGTLSQYTVFTLLDVSLQLFVCLFPVTQCIQTGT